MDRELTDDKLTTWMILEFGSLEEAWKHYNKPLFELNAPDRAECSQQIMAILELYRLRQSIK